MAYVLGYIYADGAILDVRKSSRACYLSILSTDEEILVKIRCVLGSNHPLSLRNPKPTYFALSGKTYTGKPAFILRIGSIEIYNDLAKLGLKPKKSLDIDLPNIPRAYFASFLRGYFDGDGCLYTSTRETRMIFTSGSINFLTNLGLKLAHDLNISQKTLNKQPNGAFQLKYRKRESLCILSFIYKNTDNRLYLERKYGKYQKLLSQINK